MEQRIKKVSQELSSEISQLNMIDVSSLSLLLEVRIKQSMPFFIEEYAVKEETEYLKLAEEQSRNRVGSPQYVATGYKLKQLKAKKAAANKAANCIRREDQYAKLKEFVIAEFGQDTFDKFASAPLPKNPLYSTSDYEK